MTRIFAAAGKLYLTRFTLILAQFRHWHLHLGMLMGFTGGHRFVPPHVTTEHRYSNRAV